MPGQLLGRPGNSAGQAAMAVEAVEFVLASAKDMATQGFHNPKFAEGASTNKNGEIYCPSPSG